MTTHFNLGINVDAYQDKWGGYVLKFPICTSATANDGLLPYGTTISSVTMKAYEGKIDEKTDLSSITEITTLIDDSPAPAVQNDNEVVFYLQHPGTTHNNKKCTLVAQLTLSGGEKKSFYAYYVYVGWKAA